MILLAFFAGMAVGLGAGLIGIRIQAAEIARLTALNTGLARRCAGQADALSRRAERKPLIDCPTCGPERPAVVANGKGLAR